MAFIHIEAQISPDELLKAADQLSQAELEELLKRLLARHAQRRAPSLPANEAELLCESITAFRPRFTIATIRYHADVPKDPANRTDEEEEFMTDTQEFYEAWKREHEALGRAEGLTKGRAEGLAEGAEALSKGLDVIYRVRFGAMPSELRSVVEATKDPATLLAWLQLVETSSAEAFAAAVLASTATARPR